LEFKLIQKFAFKVRSTVHAEGQLKHRFFLTFIHHTPFRQLGETGCSECS